MITTHTNNIMCLFVLNTFKQCKLNVARQQRNHFICACYLNYVYLENAPRTAPQGSCPTPPPGGSSSLRPPRRRPRRDASSRPAGSAPLPPVATCASRRIASRTPSAIGSRGRSFGLAGSPATRTRTCSTSCSRYRGGRTSAFGPTAGGPTRPSWSSALRRRPRTECPRAPVRAHSQARKPARSHITRPHAHMPACSHARTLTHHHARQARARTPHIFITIDK